ncbi:hypothetical protein RFI_14178 [Reticulomyxa filosa]|uniref:Uncharacterized protein n=1 Tax=Reticulomyxa filosa TaxID=46433 RepID=X6N9N9_RETFI|nr:hypothetical protein RFI_14178 [Reticulomyxa filosa]|eukprot:ETO23005.1 hypothetical protein RFI_14178 [Reticulomyxa filosa]
MTLSFFTDTKLEDFDMGYDATDTSEIQSTFRAPVHSLSPAKSLKNVSCIRTKIGQLEQKTHRQELAFENYEKFEPFKMTMEKYSDKKAFDLKKMIESVVEINKKTMKQFENEIEAVRNEHAKVGNDIRNLQGQLTYVTECVAQLQTQVFGNYGNLDDSKLFHKESSKYGILSANEQLKS